MDRNLGVAQVLRRLAAIPTCARISQTYVCSLQPDASEAAAALLSFPPGGGKDAVTTYHKRKGDGEDREGELLVMGEGQVTLWCSE